MSTQDPKIYYKMGPYYLVVNGVVTPANDVANG